MKFHNATPGEGWRLHWLRTERWGLLGIWRKTIWEFCLIYPAPLTWEDGNGFWQPDRHEAETDLGTVPPPLRGLFPHDEFPRSYCFHDSACGHGGLYHSDSLTGEFTFRKVSRTMADRMLRDMVRVEGNGTVRRWPVWVGVRIGALFGIGNGEKNDAGIEGDGSSGAASECAPVGPNDAPCVPAEGLQGHDR
jgi:hypothetical protein